MSSPIPPSIGTVAPNRAFILCPHCGAPAIIRSSEQITETVKHLFTICTNPDCMHSWKSSISPIYTISPSNIPNPAVDIPPCPPEYVRRRHHSPRKGDPPDPNQITIFEMIPDSAAA